jgi:hypothetical protein
VDAASLRATMSRLFPEERARREAALDQALATATEGATAGETANGPRRTPLPSIEPGAAGSGESGPVFVTHHGLAPRAPGRPRAGLRTALVAAALVSATFGVALHHRAPHAAGGLPSSAARPAEGAPPASGESGASVASGASGRPAVPSEPRAAPAAIASTKPSAPQDAPPPVVAEAHQHAPPVRHIFLPRVRPSVSPVPPAASTPSAARGPVRPPEPPDVDPTPF